MSKALHHLRERKNFRIADRIAILGNVCNYEIRIDTNAAEEKAFSLSTCVLAMVDMNADVSLMGRLINAGPQSSFMGDRIGQPLTRRESQCTAEAWAPQKPFIRSHPFWQVDSTEHQSGMGFRRLA
jgi:hypothetical protein